MATKEEIISFYENYLDEIEQPDFSTSPFIYRGTYHFEDKENLNLPALFIDEGEADTYEYAGLGSNSMLVNYHLIIKGRIKGDWEDYNNFMDDVISRINDKDNNTYWAWTSLDRVEASFDPNSDLKEFNLYLTVKQIN
ncbi:MAG: hypothetical protein ABIL39_11535 [candidate division WOR-3 bacterium]